MGRPATVTPEWYESYRTPNYTQMRIEFFDGFEVCIHRFNGIGGDELWRVRFGRKKYTLEDAKVEALKWARAEARRRLKLYAEFLGPEPKPKSTVYAGVEEGKGWDDR